ncbi:diguanylate cyclase [Rhizobium wenxiniae]|uniref:diguanylate cyclase n=1 Tax=Rhizobium wenxiniae TaxID=1737357 RepID=UPI003C27CE9C
MASWIEHSRKPYEAHHQLVGLSDREVLELVGSFRLCGFWRFNVDSGHLFGTLEYCQIFGISHCDGPLDLVRLSAAIHPDDLTVIMETFERASASQLTFHNLYRVKTGPTSFKFVRSVGKFRADDAGQGDVIGMTYELFPQASTTIGFIPDEDLLKG